MQIKREKSTLVSQKSTRNYLNVDINALRCHCCSETS
jgi:hypothetical protein